MNILVCMGSVPDTTAKIQFDAEGSGLVKTGVTFISGPYEDYPLSWAVDQQEKNASIKITVLFVGGPDTEPVIRKALAIGANEAVRINMEPTDAFNVAAQIANYVKGKNFDLVLFGKESIDFNGSQVPGMVAELLDLPFVSYCTELSVEGGKARMRREIDGGTEILEAELPLVISAQKGMAEWKIPAMRGIMAARTKPLTVLEPITAELRTKNVKLTLPPPKQGCIYIKPENIKELVGVLTDKGVI